ncbi:MAG: RNHCP domain-containing protein [Clostridiales bacterium]|jgi:DNA-directed RNA polymerase subunit RPC12/RpoP|nr:RNHCP domain-containing protein [Clostridiales bacterium]
MARKVENTGFDCLNCGETVAAIEKGTIRNHCPFCLYSLHLDILPGDRACDCRGIMRPIAIEPHSQKGLQILHECEKCGLRGRNIVADDDCREEIAEIMRRAAFG